MTNREKTNAMNGNNDGTKIEKKERMNEMEGK